MPELSALRPSRRRILIDGLELRCSIGVHEFERAGPQRVRLDVSLDLDPGAAPDRDAVSATLDYDDVREGIRRIATSRHFELQETLAHAIFAFVGGLPGVVGARVRTGKPDVYPDVQCVSYEVRGSRPSHVPDDPPPAGRRGP